MQLFRRKPRGVELTDPGRVLLEHARAVLERLDQAFLMTQKTARGEQGQLSVGIAPTGPFGPFVPQVIRAFRGAYPLVSMSLNECLSRQAVLGEPLPLRALAEETFILFGGNAGLGIADASLAACHRAGFTPRLGQQAPRIASTLGIVAAGLDVALVPVSIRRLQVDGVAYRRLLPDERPTATLRLALRRSDPSPVVRNFFDAVRQIGRAHV